MKKTSFCANLYAIGDLRYEERALPVCDEDEVLVEVKACGICGSDLGRVFTSGTYHFPTVIGHEFAGKVVSDAKAEWIGKRVAVFPLLPCFSCESCKEQNYATCHNYDYYGSRRDGGMSEYIAIKRWNLIPLPDEVSYAEGAMCEPISVARHAVLKLGLTGGKRLLITGAGPIGIIAGQWARALGASEVYYTDIDEHKIQALEGYGFKKYTEGTTIDCAIEGTGVSAAYEAALAAVKPFGTVVQMGNPAREMTLTQKGYWHILRKELTLRGTWNSAFSEKQNDWSAALAALADGSLCVKPLITHRYPLSAVNEAFAMMKEKKETYSKVMLLMNEEDENE